MRMSSPALFDVALADPRVRGALGVLAGALGVAALARVSVELPLGPVPVTGQSLGVALAGACLGARRGVLAVALYLAAAAAGLPVLAGGAGGLERLLGPSLGYLVGFLASAGIVGALADRGHTRGFLRAALSFEAGSLGLFACAIAAAVLREGQGLEAAVRGGWWPYVPGDLVKCALGAGLVTAAWWALGAGSRGASAARPGKG